MEYKCSLIDHKEIAAISYCEQCKIYMCNKCINLHKGLFKNHQLNNLDKDMNEIFIDICKEKNHGKKLEFFCKSHNQLCCGLCITTLQVKGYGQHRNCKVCIIEDIKEEKKKKLKDNIENLENLSNNIDNLINELKALFEKINESKDELKLNIQNTFTKIRDALNEREDEIILEVDKIYNEKFFNEDIIKESIKLPNIIKKSLDKGKSIDNEWNDDEKLSSLINHFNNIETNIKNINNIYKNINKCNSNKESKIEFSPKNDSLKDFLLTIKTFGSIEENKEIKKKDKEKIIKGKKKNKVDKSHVILEIKGWEADQDLESLAKKIISTIKKDGLSWDTGYKLEEVAFGVMKLVIAFLAEDEKCSVQEIVDELESWENDIQSVEVVDFKKA